MASVEPSAVSDCDGLRCLDDRRACDRGVQHLPRVRQWDVRSRLLVHSWGQLQRLLRHPNRMQGRLCGDVPSVNAGAQLVRAELLGLLERVHAELRG